MSIKEKRNKLLGHKQPSFTRKQSSFMEENHRDINKPALRVQIIVSGKVQGVFYRSSTQDMAKKLTLTGWAKNLSDGCVEIVAEGSKQNLQALIDWTWQGPPSSQVTDVKATWQPYIGEFSNFNITY